MSDDHLIEHKVSQQELLRGHFLHAFRDTVRLPNQDLATREYVVHPGAVMVIPLLQCAPGEPWRVVMERQFRYPVGQVITEFPAGKLDPGEDLWLCAQRELRVHPSLVIWAELVEALAQRGARMRPAAHVVRAHELAELCEVEV